MANPLIRVAKLGIATFVGMMLGNAISFNAFLTLFGHPSRFWSIFFNSFWILLIHYILMIITLYVQLSIFKILYYILFLLLGWHIHNVCAFLFYSFLNLFIKLPNIINIIIFFTIGTGFLIYGIYSERHTTLEKITIPCKGLKGNLTIAQLSDIHLGAVYGKAFIQKIVNLVLSVKVDVVVITGDLIDGNIKMTREMLEPFQQIKVPIYFVSGNHEDYTWKEEAFQIIDSTNIKRIPYNIIPFKNKINLIGLDYLKDESVIIQQLKDLLKENYKNNNLPNVFLYHVPILNAKELEPFNIFLFLCGHYHGGHFFPFTMLQLIREKFIFDGLYSYKDKYFVYCNSGQGSSGPPVRSFSKSQIGIITLEGV